VKLVHLVGFIIKKTYENILVLTNFSLLIIVLMENVILFIDTVYIRCYEEVCLIKSSFYAVVIHLPDNGHRTGRNMS
jgi:hypothetical protein